MVKYLLFILVFISLVNCSTSNQLQINKNDIVGEWVLAGRGGPNYIRDANRITNLVLNNDGTCEFIFAGDYNQKHTGTYKITGNKLELITYSFKRKFIDSYNIVSFKESGMEVLARYNTVYGKSKTERLLWEKAEE